MIHQIIEFYRALTNPDQLGRLLHTLLSGWVGYAAMFAVVFSETGLMVGCILPGDSFLFTIGMVARAGGLDIVQVDILFIAAVMLGDSTGYLLGRRTGPRIFTRPDSRIFKQEYVTRTKAFFDRYGGKTIVLARFVPVVRTLTFYLAGVGQMPYLRFLPFSICGGIGWVLVMTTLGYQLARFQVVKQNLDIAVLLVILLSLSPTFIEAYRARRRAQPAQASRP